MPSIVSTLRPDGPSSPTEEALEAAGRDPGQPWAPAQALPLPEIQWAMTVDPVELATNQAWPPARFGARAQRLETYFELWRGDLSRLMNTNEYASQSVGPVNIFRRYARFVADLLVRSGPTVNEEQGPLNDAELLRIAHSLFTNGIRYGASFLTAGTLNGVPWLRSIDSRYAYRMSNGGLLFVEPVALSDQPTQANALHVTRIEQGQATFQVRAGTPSGDGLQQIVGPEQSMAAELGPMMVWAIPALPEQAEGWWGTSWYDDLISTVIQKVRRMAANTRVLDDNSDPMLLMRGDLNRYTALPGIPPSAAVQSQLDPTDVSAKIRLAKRLRRAGPLVVPEGIENAEYITWDGSLEAAFSMLDQLDKDFRFLSGLPAALDSDAAVPSGVSLRRMFWQFDAAVAPLFTMTRSALTQAMTNYGQELEWENALEQIEDDPLATEREDVPDEPTARRGEGREE